MTTSFTTDILVEKNAPAYEYSGSENTPPYYFEDREISGVLYRTNNATYSFVGGVWTQSNAALVG